MQDKLEQVASHPRIVDMLQPPCSRPYAGAFLLATEYLIAEFFSEGSPDAHVVRLYICSAVHVHR